MNTQDKSMPYFPPLNGRVECGECELYGRCLNSRRYQRNRRDFTVTSGRCPRLPDNRGLMDPEQQKIYSAAFPAVFASRSGSYLALSVRNPEDGRIRKVSHSRSGHWYFRERVAGEAVKRVLEIHGAYSRKDILAQMDAARRDTFTFRCTITDYFV